MLKMEDNHQQQQQPKFHAVEDCSAQIFTLNQTARHHYCSQQPPPAAYIFPQLQHNGLPAPQGFIQYQQPHFQSLLNPYRRVQGQPHGVLTQENVGAGGNISPAVPSCLSLTFKADLNENIGKNGGLSGGGGGGGGGVEDGLLRGSEHYHVPDTRRGVGGLASPHYCWQNQGDSATRQSFWKPLGTGLSDEGSNKGGNGIKDKELQPEMNQSKYYRSCEETDESRKARFFGELEEICRNAPIAKANGGDACVETFATSTGTTAACLPATNAIVAAAEASNGDDQAPSRMDENMKERKKMKDELGSVAIFFEGLVHQLMEHQENLHRKFLVAIEKLDEERKAREQIWRQNELERLEQEAAARANERALASQREAYIVSYLEKITGQSIKLPPKIPTLELQQGISAGHINELSSSNKARGDLSLRLMNKRWPKVEVDALIQIRSSLERKFQGPGYKGPLWDEISSLMASMGFQRTAKRCKEKWENINKYFKKSRENSTSKQTRKKLKTCQYFDQLDQLYSKSSGVITNGSNSSSSSSEHQENLNTGNGLLLLPKQNEVFVPAVNLREAGYRVPTIDFSGGSMNGNLEGLKQGSIIRRIDEVHHLELDHHVEEVEEEVEEGDRNDNNVQK